MDASALLCLYLEEAGAEGVETRFQRYQRLIVGSPTIVETRIALSRKLGRDAWGEVDRLLTLFGIRVVAFSPKHAEVAQDAFLRFGKGRHPAALNFGDCMAYAVAKVAGAELVYVGDDFARTDIA